MTRTNRCWTASGLTIFAFAFILSAQDEYRYPRPDFSTIERWYQIEKWDYNESNRTMTVLVKPKVEAEKRPRYFVAKFLDKDGLDVANSPSGFCCIASINRDYQVEKISATMPSESTMDQVRHVVIFRTRDDGSHVR
jgi:hypothetical protein